MARCLAGVALAWLTATSAAAAERVVLDYTAAGEFIQSNYYYNCGISTGAFIDAALSTFADMNVNAAFGGPGIGVEGGNDGSFDAGEALLLQFVDDVAGLLVTATEISYVATEAPGVSDGDAVPAELSIEAFGPGNVSLGVEAFSGTGEVSISAAFGGAPIESVVLTATPDSVRIQRIAYLPAPGTAISVQWIFGGAYEREQIELCGVTLDGSNTLATGEQGTPGGPGVGVLGGFGGGQPDRTIDSGETLEVSFAEPASGVSYHRSSFFYPSVVGGDEFDLAAFGAGDVPLGSVHLLTDFSDISVSDRFGDAALSRFVIETDPDGQDGQQLGSVTYRVPEPGGVVSGLAALASAAGLARLARRRRRGRGIAAVVCALALAGAGVACGEREKSEPPAADAAATEPATPPDAPDGAAAARPGIPKAPPPLFPRGLVAKQPGVSGGYVLFNPLLSDTSYLVNDDGEVVHTWKTSTSPGAGMDFLPNGNLLRAGRDPEQLGFRAGGTGGILQELDWNGNVVWEWRLSEAERVLHHDIEPLPNGNVLAIAWEVKSPAEARRAGRRADQTPEQGLWPDWVLEVEPVCPRGGRIVWEWHVWDHLVQDHDPEVEGFSDPAASPGRLDVNTDADAPEIGPEELAQLQALGYVPDDANPEDLDSDFLHTNAIAYHPRLDQIALSVPELGEVWIIDHGTTSGEARGRTGGRAGRGGDLLYRWGNATAWRRGGGGDANGVRRLFYQHDVRWIPDGWEGAGNLTVFNNGRDRPEGSWSSVDEWTPPVDADGRYALDGGAFGPLALAWQYRAPEPTRFYAPFISGAERLPNGNTLVCSGTGGEFFEVTRGGEIVWEYRSPFSGDVRNADGSMPQPGLEENPYAVFRATRIPADHPGLAGRALAPLEPRPPWFDSREQARDAAPGAT